MNEVLRGFARTLLASLDRRIPERYRLPYEVLRVPAGEPSRRFENYVFAPRETGL